MSWDHYDNVPLLLDNRLSRSFALLKNNGQLDRLVTLKTVLQHPWEAMLMDVIGMTIWTWLVPPNQTLQRQEQKMQLSQIFKVVLWKSTSASTFISESWKMMPSSSARRWQFFSSVADKLWGGSTATLVLLQETWQAVTHLLACWTQQHFRLLEMAHFQTLKVNKFIEKMYVSIIINDLEGMSRYHMHSA